MIPHRHYLRDSKWRRRSFDISIPVKLPWIFPGAPLKFNGAPGKIQGNLTAMHLAALRVREGRPVRTDLLHICVCHVLHDPRGGGLSWNSRLWHFARYGSFRGHTTKHSMPQLIQNVWYLSDGKRVLSNKCMYITPICSILINVSEYILCVIHTFRSYSTFSVVDKRGGHTIWTILGSSLI